MDRLRVQQAYDAGDFPACEALIREQLAREPEDAVALHGLGAALMAQGRFTDARAVLERYHLRMPEDRVGCVSLGKMRLATGDFAGGWPLYDARLTQPTYVTEIPPFPAWRGEPLAGKTIVVWREQGFGDMIMGLRFLPILREMGARVIAVTRPALVRLYASLGFEAIPHGGAPGTFVALPVEPDYYGHPLSIPRWLGLTPSSIPRAPYLSAGPARSGGVGVVWRGRAEHQHDRFRSLPAGLGARLLALPGAVDLEPAATSAHDFLDTAEIVAGLDHVISVDTSVAHLAGAMGKPVSLLLPAHGLDWRWMEGRRDSPWYPSARLYRQQAPGDWAPVLAEIMAGLAPRPQVSENAAKQT